MSLTFFSLEAIYEVPKMSSSMSWGRGVITNECMLCPNIENIVKYIYLIKMREKMDYLNIAFFIRWTIWHKGGVLILQENWGVNWVVEAIGIMILFDNVERDMVLRPYNTRSDSFYFVNDTLIMWGGARSLLCHLVRHVCTSRCQG